jgi:retron-type reverse transcriptase
MGNTISPFGGGVDAVEGVPQGGVASPLLANIYLHYVFDLWAERWRRHHAQGNVILVRYADDIVAGFEHEADAERFQAERERVPLV